MVHRPSRMIIDVDSLSRYFGALTSQHIKVSALLSCYDRRCRPASYTGGLSSTPRATSFLAGPVAAAMKGPVLTTAAVNVTKDSVTACQYPPAKRHYSDTIIRTRYVVLRTATRRFHLATFNPGPRPWEWYAGDCLASWHTMAVLQQRVQFATGMVTLQPQLFPSLGGAQNFLQYFHFHIVRTTFLWRGLLHHACATSQTHHF